MTFQEEVTRWAEATFPTSTPRAKLVHLFEELEEAYEEVYADAVPNEHLCEELADVGLIGLHLAASLGVDIEIKHPGLLADMRAKFMACKQRAWGEADCDGVVRHVAGSEAIEHPPPTRHGGSQSAVPWRDRCLADRSGPAGDPGPFDLDPCAAPEPRPWPTAAHHIALPDDGLTADWRARVFLNPPYGPETGQWLERLAEHGNGIALIFARTETAMFRDFVWRRAAGILFLFGRLYFYRPDGRRGDHNGGAPSVLVAYGRDNADCLRCCGLTGQFVPLEANHTKPTVN